MGSCVGRAPATLDDILPILNACATAAGGADWVSDLILGAQAAVLLLCCAVVVGYVVGRVAR